MFLHLPKYILEDVLGGVYLVGASNNLNNNIRKNSVVHMIFQ